MICLTRHYVPTALNINSLGKRHYILRYTTGYHSFYYAIFNLPFASEYLCPGTIKKSPFSGAFPFTTTAN